MMTFQVFVASRWVMPPILGVNKCDVNRLFIQFQIAKKKLQYEFVAARGIFCMPIDAFFCV